MRGILKIGNFVGIKIEVHWTFALLLIWAALLEIRRGANLDRIMLNQAFILLLFVCVLLHELGHALMAKRFKIGTQKIMLLPIGGIATLQKMPQKPGQELLVALAGPAVNLAIAVLLAFVVPIRSYFNFKDVVLDEILYEVSLQNFLFHLFIANLMLVFFNLIPAFPMDGGRGLRAVLAFTMGREAATRMATRIGQVLAFLFLVLGLLLNPILILITLFIFLAAYGENEMVRNDVLLKGHTASEALLRDITRFHPGDTVQMVIDRLLESSEKDFVVMEDNLIVGLLYQKDIIKSAHDPTMVIGKIMHRNFQTVELSTEITTVLELMAKERTHFFPVTQHNELIGAIDRNNISEFILYRNSVSKTII